MLSATSSAWSLLQVAKGVSLIEVTRVFAMAKGTEQSLLEELCQTTVCSLSLDLQSCPRRWWRCKCSYPTPGLQIEAILLKRLCPVRAPTLSSPISLLTLLVDWPSVAFCLFLREGSLHTILDLAFPAATVLPTPFFHWSFPHLPVPLPLKVQVPSLGKDLAS